MIWINGAKFELVPMNSTFQTCKTNMVLKHNKLPFDHDDFVQVGFQHVQLLDCGGQFVSSHRHNHEKHHFSDGVRLGNNLDYDKSGSGPNASKLLSWVLNSDGETVRSENSKRPSDADENDKVASKRTRQVDGSFPSFSSTCEGSFTSYNRFKTRKDAAVLEGVSFPSFTYSARLEDSKVSFSPEYYEDPNHASRYDRVEETLLPVFNYRPRKNVPLGPCHQADLPEWKMRSDALTSSVLVSNLPEWRKRSDASTSSVHVSSDEKSSDKWIRHCVLPMPDLSFAVLEQSKIDCHCLDKGSIRCVRQHVNKAREKLRSNLGHERFEELGMYDMGEDVASEWTEEEEQIFHEVVISNPASLRKNFWKVLPRAFPSRSNRELVSYYFNVFMLRKRAEQNRSDPLNVDSDDDEWQEIDDGEFGEHEDDDSGLESPTDVYPPNNGNNEVDILEEGEGDDYEEDNHCGVTKPKIEDQDVHDDSCMSYEEQHTGAKSSGDTTDHDFVVGHCDPKSWEIGYIRGFEGDYDLLPTCDVIEEVFGNEKSLEKKSKGGDGVK